MASFTQHNKFAGPVWDEFSPHTVSYDELYNASDDERKDAPEGCSEESQKNLCMDLPAKLFQLRGEGYLSQSETNVKELKVPSEESAYQFVAMKTFQSTFDMQDSASKIAGVKKYLEELEAHDAALTDESEKEKLSGDAPKYIVHCWNFSNLWKTEYISVVHFFRRKRKINMSGDDQSPFEKAFSRFITADDETRCNKLKFACRIKVGNETLLSSIRMLGGERPVIIGRRLTTTFYNHPSHFEICCDVGSSTVASMLNNIIKSASGSMVIDECIVVEAQNEDELPELAIGCCRFEYCQLEDVGIRLDDMGNIV